MKANLQHCQAELLVLAKEGHKYFFLFDRKDRDAMLGQFARFAKDPELNFSWNDAAVLSRKMRRSRSLRVAGEFATNRRSAGLSYETGELS